MIGKEHRQRDERIERQREGETREEQVKDREERGKNKVGWALVRMGQPTCVVDLQDAKGGVLCETGELVL